MHWIGSKMAHAYEWDMPLWTDQYQAKGECSKVAHVVYAALEQCPMADACSWPCSWVFNLANVVSQVCKALLDRGSVAGDQCRVQKVKG